jgi:energy-coupling factor transporter ATP-binding protein EcfA2
MNWRQGEHVTAVGTTGSGKSEAILSMVNQVSPFTVVVTTKQTDKTLHDGLRGYRVITKADHLNPEVARRFVFRATWPRGEDWKSQILPRQRDEIRRLVLRIFRQKGWTVLFDELPYVTSNDMLGLSSDLKLLWLQGRSEGVSVFANTQRPRHVPLEAYSQATHLLLWNTSDAMDLARAGDLAAFDRKTVAQGLSTLGKHDILYVNSDTKDIFVTNTRW